MTQAAYLVEATDQYYSAESLAWIGSQIQKNAITATAALLGISAGAIAGAMAEENTSYLQEELRQSAMDQYALSGVDPEEFGADVAALGLAGALAWNSVKLVTTERTHAEFLADYEWLASNTDEDGRSMLDAHDVMSKALHPALVDLGKANFKLATAITLLRDYLVNNPSDPLRLNE